MGGPTWEVVVLGANGTYPSADGAASGYLLRAGETNVWMDAGTGTFSNLQRHVDYHGLTAMVITHRHLDHVLDFWAFYYGLRYSIGSKGPCDLEVVTSGEVVEYLKRLVPEEPEFAGYFAFNTVRPGDPYKVGELEFTSERTIHPVETLAMRIEHEGRVLTFTADTGPSDKVTALAEGSDVLIAEATVQESIDRLKEVHMNAEEAGQMAANARVSRLVLTHLSPGLDPGLSIEQASRWYDGPIEVATDHLVIPV